MVEQKKTLSPEKRALLELEVKRLRAENMALQNEVELPHIYGWKWYKWARKFRESRNPVTILCAANQISKSSTQIRTAIEWATDKSLWTSLWPTTPNLFWYLYPTQKQVNQEFQTKWKQFLPRGDKKDDPVYGWRTEAGSRKEDIVAIHFNSGVSLYFKTYAQNTSALQTGSVYALFCDEELPQEHYEELMFRISAVDGYFRMVFTATIGQDFWRRAMEPEEHEQEELPDAEKMTVSLYDSMEYEDGSPSPWSLEKIKRIEARCSSHQEVLKRVYGKFIVLGDRKYGEFDLKRHMKPPHPIPKSWYIFVGADYGSNASKRAHKSALCYVAVRPDYRAARVFMGWRGDDTPTTAGDVVEKHIGLTKERDFNYGGKYYDWSSADFGLIAERSGHPFEKAEKSHSIGEDFINTLFKNDMLFIYEDPELAKLAAELGSLKKTTAKKDAKDDFCDGLRYAISKVPWDWTVLFGEGKDWEEPDPGKEMSDVERQIIERRKAFDQDQEDEKNRVEDEIDEWNEEYGNY